MPKIRRTAKISRRAVRSRVLASLDEETAETAPAHRRAAHWKMGRIPAVLIAAAVLVSGSAGQRQCRHRSSGSRRL